MEEGSLRFRLDEGTNSEPDRLVTTVIEFSTDPDNARRWRQLSLAFLVFGVLVRIFALYSLRDQPLIGDAASYDQVSKQILSGTHFYPYWPPALPYYLACWHFLLGAGATVARVAMLVLFVVFAFLFRQTLRLSSNERLTAFGMVALAISPVWILHSLDPLTHFPVAFCLILALFALFKFMRQPRLWYAALFGISLGAMILFRTSSVLLLAALPLVCSWRMKSWKFLWASIVPALLILGSWLVIAENLAGEFVWVNGSNNENFYYGNSQFTPEYRTWWIGSHGGLGLPDSARLEKLRDSVWSLPHASQSRYYGDAAIKYIEEYPVKFLRRTFNRISVYLAADSFTASYAKNLGFTKLSLLIILLTDATIYFLLVTLSAALLTFHWRDVRRNTPYLVMYLVMLLYAIPYWISFSHPQYHTPLLPLMFVSSLLFLKLSPWRDWRTLWMTRASLGVKVAFLSIMAFAIFSEVRYAIAMASRI